MRGYKIRAGCFEMKIKYLQRKPSGLYCYRRGIPEDLRPFCQGRREIKLSLRTHDQKEAIKLVDKLAWQHDRWFEQLKTQGARAKAVQLLESYGLVDAPLDRQPLALDVGVDALLEEGSPYWHLVEQLSYKYSSGADYEPADAVDQRALDILHGKEKVTLAEIKQDELKKYTGRKKKQDEIKRCFGYYEKHLPTTVLSQIRAKDAQLTSDILLKSLKTATVKKALGIVRKAFRTAIKLYDMDINNPFDGVELLGVGADTEKRHTFSFAELASIRIAILDKSQFVTAQILGLLFDTGCRCGEVGGLKLSDIRLDDAIPNIRIRPESNRKLKNEHSRRPIPLTGISLLAANWIMQSSEEGQVYAFERYNKGGVYNNASCTNAVNKLLKSILSNGTSHSFRHAMSDRLYEAGIARPETNNLMGWSDGDMADYYGISEGLNRLRKALDQMHFHEAEKRYFE